MTELDQRGALRGVFWTALQAGGVRLSAFVVFIVMARLLSPADFGLIAMAGVFIAVSQALVEQGFGTAITQREALEPEHESTAFWTNLVLGIALAGGFWLCAPWVAALYRTPELTPVLRWLSPVLLLRANVAVPVGLLQRRFKFRALAVRSLLAALAGGVAGVAAGFAGWGVYALVLQQIVTAAADLAVVWSAAAWRPKLIYSLRHLRELVGFGSYIFASGVFGLVTRRSSDLLIGVLLGDVVLGVYSVAYRGLEILLQLLSKPGGLVAIPAFSRLQTQPERMREVFYRSVQAASAITMPGFVGVSALAPIAVPLVFGEQYQESGAVLRPLALMGVVYSVGQFNYAAYLGRGRPDLPLKLSGIRAVLTVLGFALVVRWGIVAVAIAHVASLCLMVPLELVILGQLIGVSARRYFASLAPVAAACAVMVIVLLAFMRSGLHASVLLALSVPLGAVVYLFSLYLMQPALVRELGSQLSLLVRRRTAL